LLPTPSNHVEIGNSRSADGKDGVGYALTNERAGGAGRIRADCRPYCGDVFVFRPKRCDRLRLVFWDGSGMVLRTKWLESGRFVWPPIRDGSMRLTREEFALLVAGLDWTRVAPHPSNSLNT